MLSNPPRVWLNASTATIYRHALDRPMDEATGQLGGNEVDAPDTWNFSIRVAKDWETAFFEAPTPLTRKIAMRSAITFSPKPGNAFAVLLNLVRVGLGGKQGNGRQFVSWIHENDFARAVEFLIDTRRSVWTRQHRVAEPRAQSRFHVCAAGGMGNAEWFAAPAPLLELGAVFMRTETELVLKSRRVVPERLLDAGFKFEFPNWPHAAEDLVEQWRNTGTIDSNLLFLRRDVGDRQIPVRRENFKPALLFFLVGFLVRP